MVDLHQGLVHHLTGRNLATSKLHKPLEGRKGNYSKSATHLTVCSRFIKPCLTCFLTAPLCDNRDLCYVCPSACLPVCLSALLREIKPTFYQQVASLILSHHRGAPIFPPSRRLNSRPSPSTGRVHGLERSTHSSPVYRTHMLSTAQASDFGVVDWIMTKYSRTRWTVVK